MLISGITLLFLGNVAIYDVYGGGLNGGTNGGSVRANCVHSHGGNAGTPSKLFGCIIKSIIIPENKDQIRVFTNPLANVSITTKVPINVTNLPINNGGITRDARENDIVELDCDYNRSASEISRCEALGIIQVNPENQIKINQNSLATLNATARLPINSTTLLPYNNSIGTG